jgi:hypothetical protein
LHAEGRNEYLVSISTDEQPDASLVQRPVSNACRRNTIRNKYEVFSHNSQLDLIDRKSSVYGRRACPRDQVNPVVLVATPDTNLTLVADPGNVEPTSLVSPVPLGGVSIPSDEPVPAARRSAYLFEDGGDYCVCQRQIRGGANPNELASPAGEKVIAVASEPGRGGGIVRPARLRWTEMRFQD